MFDAVPNGGSVTIADAKECIVDMSAGQLVIDGFGFSSAWCGTLSSAKNNALYGTLGMSLLRVQIDPSGYWDAETANAAAAHAAGAKVLGSTWYGPSQWTAKRYDSSGNEQTYLLPEHYGDFATWLKSAVSAHNLDWISPSNEPDLGWMAWTSDDLKSWIGQYGGSLGKPLVAPESCWFADTYTNAILNDSAAGPNVSIAAGHGYGTNPSVHQTPLSQGKHVWMTEHYIDGQDDLSACMGIAQEISDYMNCQFSAYFWWWVHDSDTNVNLVESNGAIHKNGYVMGQFAKWIRPGSTRVGADYNPQPNLSVTAYKVNNATVIVAVNTGSNSITQQFCISNGNAATFEGYRTSVSENMADIGAFIVQNGEFAATLPAKSVTTFTQSSSVGVVFYQNYSYGGTASPVLASGSYTQTQLAALGVPDHWASSAKIPSGWSATLYGGASFSGTQWTLNSDTASFGSLSPSANDQMCSCIIRQPSPELTGTVIGSGTARSGYTFAKVFDNDLTTYFDGRSANGCWVGLDFGSGTSHPISEIKYCPRASYESRMLGGIFQGANQADFSDAVTLATVASQPTAGLYTSAFVTGTTSFRYVRYLSPNGSYGDVAELKFYAPQVAPPSAPSLTALPHNQQVELSWTAPDGALSYKVKRATTSGGPYSTIATPTATHYADSSVVNGTPCFYVVSAVNAGGETNSSEAAATPTPNDAVALTGTVIGTPGSFGGFGSTIPLVFDNDLSTFFDGPQADGCWAGLDFGAGNVLTQINYCPREAYPDRMVGGVFQGANQADFSDAVSLATVGSQPPTGSFTSVVVSNTTAFCYVHYLSPNGSFGNVAEVQFIGYQLSPATVALQGSIIGTPGSYGNLGNTVSKAFDNDTGTYFDGPTANGCWAGLDFGAGESSIITRVQYCPRSDAPQRMVGGLFQGANQADFSDAVTLFTIANQPQTGVYTRASVANKTAFRYVRYLSPNGGWGNVAELQFFGHSLPTIPNGLSATGGNTNVVVSWSVSGTGSATSCNVKRATSSGGPYTTIANVTSSTYTDTGLANGTTYYYVVSGVNSAGESANSSQASATTYTALEAWRFYYFGTPSNSGNAADSADPDGDGCTNAQEFASGTDPTNRASCLKINQMHASGNDMVLSFSTVTGKTYRVERSDTLQSNSWTTVQDNIAGTGGTVQVTDSNGVGKSKRFYRLLAF
jgi:glucuronoarabinoxylan endo-1,4-beta-xylanase